MHLFSVNLYRSAAEVLVTCIASGSVWLLIVGGVVLVVVLLVGVDVLVAVVLVVVVVVVLVVVFLDVVVVESLKRRLARVLVLNWNCACNGYISLTAISLVHVTTLAFQFHRTKVYICMRYIKH